MRDVGGWGGGGGGVSSSSSSKHFYHNVLDIISSFSCCLYAIQLNLSHITLMLHFCCICLCTAINVFRYTMTNH
mgnify:FL=1